MNTEVFKSYIGSVKTDFTNYYEVFYSRKAAPPICVALCCSIIIIYVLGRVI
jgi:hypothetical protein